MPGPRVQFSQSIAAGATFDALQSSIYRYLPFNAFISLVAWTTATGVTMQALSGSELILPSAPVEFGAPAAGRIPRSGFDVTPLEFSAPAGDLLQILFTNTTAGALTISGIIDFTPA
jgi:hypothetical protein